VTFVVIDGGGAIAGDTAVTDGGGRAMSGLWTVGPRGGQQRVRAQAGPAAAEPVQLVFSAFACDPGSCRLVYVSGDAIFTLDEHTGLSQRLTSDGKTAHPAWSPDGTRIAFTHTSGNWMSADIWVMNADGTGQARVTGGNVFHSPSWSPRGDALAFAGDSSLCVYECAIYVQQLAEGSVPRLVAPMGADPAWSPDGSRIAFVGLSGDDGYQSLRLVAPDGSGNVEVTPVDEGAIRSPAWSPDGTRIAFAKCMRGACDIHTVRPDGSELTRLTNVGNASWHAAWSADGTRIAFTRWSGGVPSIMSVPAAGGAARTLIDPGHSPAWRP
jgi:Tol biopolymer transport system component